MRFSRGSGLPIEAHRGRRAGPAREHGLDDRERRKEKTDSKRDQLAELLRRRAEKAQMKRISPGQQRIFRLASMNPEETHYNLVAAYRLDGPLNTADVLRAVDALAARHDVLRALFAKVEGDTRMKIAGVGEIPVPVTEHDLSPDPDREEKLRALVAR